MKITDVAFFSYPVSDLRRARAFYESVLNLTMARSFGDELHGAIEYDIAGATLCIANVFDCFAPSPNGGMIALEVEDFDVAVARLREHRSPYALAPYESPLCRGVVFSDPDGNSVMLHQRKSTL